MRKNKIQDVTGEKEKRRSISAERIVRKELLEEAVDKQEQDQARTGQRRNALGVKRHSEAANLTKVREP